MFPLIFILSPTISLSCLLLSWVVLAKIADACAVVIPVFAVLAKIINYSAF